MPGAFALAMMRGLGHLVASKSTSGSGEGHHSKGGRRWPMPTSPVTAFLSPCCGSLAGLPDPPWCPGSRFAVVMG